MKEFNNLNPEQIEKDFVSDQLEKEKKIQFSIYIVKMDGSIFF